MYTGAGSGRGRISYGLYFVGGNLAHVILNSLTSNTAYSLSTVLT